MCLAQVKSIVKWLHLVLWPQTANQWHRGVDLLEDAGEGNLRSSGSSTTNATCRSQAGVGSISRELQAATGDDNCKSLQAMAALSCSSTNQIGEAKSLR